MITFTIVLGLIYPSITLLIGQLFFRDKASGSLIKKNEKIIGSSLIGQAFASEGYFHSRPSVNDYDAMKSSPSNLGPASKKLFDEIQQREKKYRKNNNTTNDVPIDALTSSGSGLDPHISKKNAYLQAKRISENRRVPIQKIISLIDEHVEKPTLWLLGTERVNVLLLNLALDQL